MKSQFKLICANHSIVEIPPSKVAPQVPRKGFQYNFGVAGAKGMLINAQAALIFPMDENSPKFKVGKEYLFSFETAEADFSGEVETIENPEETKKVPVL